MKGTTKRKGKRQRALDGEELKEKVREREGEDFFSCLVLSQEELELLMLSDGEGEGVGKEHFSLSSILRAEQMAARGKGKRRRREEQAQEEGGVAREFKVDVQDPRFKALYESHLFAPDPSAPQYRWVCLMGVWLGFIGGGGVV